MVEPVRRPATRWAALALTMLLAPLAAAAQGQEKPPPVAPEPVTAEAASPVSAPATKSALPAAPAPTRPALPARVVRLTDFLIEQARRDPAVGGVLAVARDGQTLLVQPFGRFDPASEQAMPADAVFDLSWLTQPVVAAGALLLQEQGRWLISDRVGRYLPAFTRSDLTLLDLLRQSSGLASAIMLSQSQPGQALPPELSQSLEVATRLTGKRFISQLAQSPSLRPAGQVSQRDFSYDVLGLAIEAAAGQDLGSLLQREFFVPMELWDTGFFLGKSQIGRFVAPLPTAAGAAATVGGHHGMPLRPHARKASDTLGFDCGASCLLSTAPDYLRFAQWLLQGGGSAPGRPLGSGSRAMLTRDQLHGRIDNRIGLPGEVPAYGSSAQGYGFGVAVQTSHQRMMLPGEPGGFGVAAPGGQYFWVDPSSRLVTVLLARTPDSGSALRLQQQVQALVYQAFAD